MACRIARGLLGFVGIQQAISQADAGDRQIGFELNGPVHHRRPAFLFFAIQIGDLADRFGVVGVEMEVSFNSDRA
jgi:hypothetical protein